MIFNIYFNGSRKNKYIALTYDDGPSEDTKYILKLLRKENAKATFFVIGKRINGNEGILKKIIKQGSEMGNHTFNHKSLRFKKWKFIINEIKRTDEELNKLDIRSDLFRFPNFQLDFATIIMCYFLNKKIIFTDVVSNDWMLKGVDFAYNEVIKRVKNGSIIALHDNFAKLGRNKYAVEITKRLIPELKERGFQLVTVSELLKN